MSKSREQFEEWFKKELDADMVEYGEVVVNLVKRRQFKVWQASRESLEVELPRKYDEDDEYDYFAIGYNSAIETMEEFLANDGVKVK